MDSIFTLTFISHLADTFIQINLQMRNKATTYFSQGDTLHSHSCNIKLKAKVLLTCSCDMLEITHL